MYTARSPWETRTAFNVMDRCRWGEEKMNRKVLRFIPLSGITRNQVHILVILVVEDLILISHVILSKLKKKYKVRAKQHRERMPQISKLSFYLKYESTAVDWKRKEGPGAIHIFRPTGVVHEAHS